MIRDTIKTHHHLTAFAAVSICSFSASGVFTLFHSCMPVCAFIPLKLGEINISNFSLRARVYTLVCCIFNQDNAMPYLVLIFLVSDEMASYLGVAADLNNFISGGLVWRVPVALLRWSVQCVALHRQQRMLTLLLLQASVLRSVNNPDFTGLNY